ncbi:MAG TPA: methylated-DNA--[protein]-cysteine S-methyltransferase [Bacteroidota bacterium]|nr:methylated-DNA--[protein]-cysteine S-methyltransferase [Bacteroidota bacterium]
MYDEVAVRTLVRGGMRSKRLEKFVSTQVVASEPAKATDKVFCTSFESRIGRIYVASSERGVCKISVPNENHRDFFRWLTKHFDSDAVVDNRSKNRDIIDQLNRYFNGRLVRFTVPIDLIGTPFQLKVWRELAKVSYGSTASYKQIARRISIPGASQAVGKANAVNPLPIIIPCHRVLGANGSLIGYSCGIKTKEFLLRLEGAILI